VFEGGLHWMQRAVFGEAFNGGDLRAVRLGREDIAGFDCAAVEVDGACAALGRIAADVRAGEPELIAKELHKQGAGLD
jgi:hypothetical protein